MNDTGRIGELDALRGIAALWVLLFHYLTRYDQIYGAAGRPLIAGGITFPDGLYAVHLFFMISGFVIFMTLRTCAGAPDFIVSRFSRLYPAYWAGLSMTGALAALLPLPGQSVSLGLLAANATMLQDFLLRPALDGAYWSLTIELAFYAMMLALFMTGQLRRVETMCWVWLAVAVTAHLPPPFTLPLPYRVGFLLAIAYVQCFVAGITFYLVWLEGYTVNRALLLIACLGAAALAADPGDHPVPYAVAFFGLFHFVVKGHLRRVGAWPVLIWLGAISYPLYLTHQMIGFRIILALLAWNVPPLVALASVIACALALASLISYLIERPSMRLIRRQYRRFGAGRVGRNEQPTREISAIE